MSTTVPYDLISERPRKQPWFKTCCFCFPLRIGCFVLGYLNLVLNVFSIIGIIGVTFIFGVFTNGYDHLDPEMKQKIGAELSDLDVSKSGLHILLAVLIVALIVNIIWFFFNIACLVGIHKRKPGPVRVYVTFATIRLLLVFVGYSFVLSTTDVEAQQIVGYIFNLVLNAYFIIVYYTYATQLQNEEEDKLTLAAQSNLNAALRDSIISYPTKEKDFIIA